MHLEKVYINNYGKCKTRLNAKQLRAKQEHDAWLRKRGLHPEQIATKKKANPVRYDPVSDYTITSRQTIKTSDKEPEVPRRTRTAAGTRIRAHF